MNSPEYIHGLFQLRQEEDDGTWSHLGPAEIDGKRGGNMSVRAGDSNLASDLEYFGSQVLITNSSKMEHLVFEPFKDFPLRDFILHHSAKVNPFSPNHDAALLFLKFALTFSYRCYYPKG